MSMSKPSSWPENGLRYPNRRVSAETAATRWPRARIFSMNDPGGTTPWTRSGMGPNDEVALLHETAGLVVGDVVATWLGAASGVDELAFVLEHAASANDTAAATMTSPTPRR